jgi:peptidase E
MNRRDILRAGAALSFASLPMLRPSSARAEAAVRKLLIYGGDFNAGFIRYAASLTGKANPRICLLPTASGDAPGNIVRWFEICTKLPIRPFVQRAFISSHNQKESFETVFAGMDAILVGGGNTLNMIAVWKAQGIDKALRTAWENGVVLGGGSAGSLCWFEQGTTDSRPGDLSTVEGLGFISGSHCPHYDAEAGRRPLYHSKIKSGEFKPGYACDDRAGIYFENGAVKQAVALDDKSNAFFVSKRNDEVIETILPKVVLPA